MSFGDMDQLRQIFFQECEEQLAALEAGLLEIENGDSDPEIVNAVFRAVHSIKGGAGAFALDDLVHFAHIFETVLDEVRKGRLSSASPVIDTLLRASDLLADFVRCARDGGEIDAARNEAITAELAALSGQPATGNAAAEEENLEDLGFMPVAVAFPFDAEPAAIELDNAEPPLNEFTVAFTPHPSLYKSANEPAILLRELQRLGEIVVTCDSGSIPSLQDLDPEGAYLSWSIELTTTHDESAIREVFEFVDGDCDLAITTKVSASAAPEFDLALPETPAEGPSDADIEALLRKVREEAAQDAAPEPLAGVPEEAPSRATEVVEDLPSAASDATAAEALPPATPDAAPAAAKSAPGKSAKAAAADAAQQTIRVDLDRVDRLMNLVGELVINQAMLSQRLVESGLARSTEVTSGLDEFEQLTRDIQEGVMAIRAQPVKSVFQRMPRLVREVAAATGKKVRLVTEGEETEVDKTVIERLADPLTHMLRNAIDHGLESPETRLAAGKREEGLVRLSAAHRSGRIVIDVADDGAGINRARVRQIAETKGLISPNAQLSEDEIDNLIFLPGFSTASTISDISGRGVGMDVVKRSIQALGGRVSIASRPGEGSTFTMSLPLTLAVLYGMVVTVAEQTLVVPLTSIIETLKPKPREVRSFGGDARVIEIRNNFIPLIDVGRELGYRSQSADPGAGVALLVESEGGAHSALLVDAIQGQRQVVIKSLEENYGRVPGIAAATILGDGRVALILDVDGVVSGARNGGIASESVLALAG
jgi:two-component system chemotaxis sensor kinase CheA